jgi:hypothetical protein
MGRNQYMSSLFESYDESRQLAQHVEQLSKDRLCGCPRRFTGIDVTWIAPRRGRNSAE